MSTKHSRPSSTPSNHHGANSKLPKFLHKSSRDRSKSMTDPSATTPTGSSASLASSSSASTASSSSQPASSPEAQRHRSSRLAGVRERENTLRPQQLAQLPPSPPSPADTSVDSSDEPLVIVDPPSASFYQPRARTRSERPISSISDIHPSLSLYSSPSSSSRISDLPTRLSGWFSHTFSSSSTDLSLPNLLSQSTSSTSSSPKGKSSALLAAAQHGKGHLNKAVRYILDSDATPDKCTESIWLLGVQHPGYEPPPPPSSSASSATLTGRRSSIDSRRSPSFRSSSSSSSHTHTSELSQSQPASSAHTNSKHPGAHWPPVFYSDFTSRIWLTYRSHFQPIRDTTLSSLEAETASLPGAVVVPNSPSTKKWGWLGGEKGWTSDTGWGCMLRTGQSLLANALLHLHLGRDWRRPPYPVHTSDFATYVQILTWFLDTPSPNAPFSVHRMALAGKDLGKDVGQWFGPSTAAGAIKVLTHAFPESSLGVSVASDGVVFQSDVFAASHAELTIGSPRRHTRAGWGDRAVLVLVGIRLGIDGVNPVYYNSIKALYTFPQSVGIAGGRPSSSYYFVGAQADSLFYLDPHHTRQTVPFRSPPPQFEREATPDRDKRGQQFKRSPPSSHQRAPTSPSSSPRIASSASNHAPLSPSPLQQQFSSSSAASSGSSSSQDSHATSSVSSPVGHGRWASSAAPSTTHSYSQTSDHDIQARPFTLDSIEDEPLDPVRSHYATAYSAEELRTFHCDRVRKMPLSGLDPSMLIGFLCRNEKDWRDLRRRVEHLSTTYKTIFTIQDEPPTWPSDSDDNMGLESISDPEDMDMDMPDDDDDANDDGDDSDELRNTRGRRAEADRNQEKDENENEQFFDTRSPSTSPEASEKGKRSSEVDTEDSEDPMGPLTPGPGRATFDVVDSDGRKGRELKRAEGEGEVSFEMGESVSIDVNGEHTLLDDDDDWVDSSISSPVEQAPPMSTSRIAPKPPKPSPVLNSVPVLSPPPIAHSKSTSSTSSGGSGKKGKKKKKGTAVATAAFPFPVTVTQDMPLPPASSRIDAAGSKRMHTARARDGGRTQSGGVKGILTTE